VYILRLAKLKEDDIFLHLFNSHLRDLLTKIYEGLTQLKDLTDYQIKVQDLRGRDFIFNIIHLTTYLLSFTSNKIENEPLILTYEYELIDFAELLYNILAHLSVSYTTLPDIRASISQASTKEILVRLETNYLQPNGGLFFTLVRLFVKLITYSQSNESKLRLSNLLHSYLVLPPPKGKTDASELLLRIEKSNSIMRELTKFSSLEGYFKVNSQDKALQKRRIVINFLSTLIL
jgi:hypothetical protein